MIANKSEPLKFNWENKKILVVEDEDSNFLFIQALIRKTGASLVRASTGIEAVELSKQHQFDLVLLDIRLPLMNGYEAVPLLKQINPHTPIIAQTAYALYGDKARALKEGCDDYIAKPTESMELMTLMQKHLFRIRN